MGEYDVAGVGKVNTNNLKNDSFFNEEGKGDDEIMHMTSDGSFKKYGKSDNKYHEFGKSQYSIFSRINYLLEMHQDDQVHYETRDKHLDASKCETLITLITSFYLNLA